MFGFFRQDTPAEAAPTAPDETGPKPGWAERLRQGLAKTRQQLSGQLTNLFGRHKAIDDALYEELETILLAADVGIDATGHLLDRLRQQVRRERLETADQLQSGLRDALAELLTPLEAPLTPVGHRPYVIMLAGVNGAGKTTTIGKLAKRFQAEGHSVLLAAGDTFRAAAREQLMVWGERNRIAVIAQEGNDAAAVIFDAIHAARARNIDIVLADTAGRLHTQAHLMEELKKVRRVIAKADASAPHEVLLVVDGNTGQNAIAQVKAFDDAVGVSGLVVTKLDGSAKGGVIAALARTRPIPIRYIGVGESIDDLRPFNAREFADALFDSE